MGICCEIAAVPSDEIRQLLDDPESAVAADFSRSVGLEKAWHGLHFLLTGDVMGGAEPLCFLLAGGREVDETLRIFDAPQVRSLDQALSQVSDEELWRRFDPSTMSAQGVYPDIWDESETELRDEYTEYFRDMKTLIAAAAKDDMALLVRLA
ncbi:MAG: YfbM family protein [Planctomycetaceae bacterium]